MQGNLDQQTIAGVVRTLYVGRESGILHVSHGKMQKRIYFKNGSIIFANSDILEDRLGEFLIRAGKISRQSCESAVTAAKEKGIRFGRAVAEACDMPQEDMEVLVGQQIEAIIHSLFLWAHGGFRFEHNDSPVDEDIVLDLSTADIIMEGIRRMNDLGAIRKALGDLGQVPCHSENPLLLYQKVSLSPSEGFVLSRVDGVSSVADIAAVSPLGEEETVRCVYGLVSAGVLELGEGGRAGSDIPGPEAGLPAQKAKRKRAGPTPEEEALRQDIISTHASLRTATNYELLGTAATASAADITKAYKTAVKKYHPDRHHSPHFRDLRGQLEEIFTKIQSAYDTLSDPFTRRRYDSSLRTEAPRGEVPSAAAQTPLISEPSRSEKTARDRYKEGKRYFEMENYFDAIQCLREAVRLSPSKPAYRKLLAQALIKNPRWIGEAADHFKKVLEADPCDADCYLGLGEIYAAAGMTTRAQRMFAEALKCDPNNEAVKEKSGKGGGVTGGLKKMLRLKNKGSST